MDALPVVIPFFGLMLCITTGWGVCVSRRIRLLENRVEAIESRPQRPTTPLLSSPPYYTANPYPYLQQPVYIPPPSPSAPPADYPKMV